MATQKKSNVTPDEHKDLRDRAALMISKLAKSFGMDDAMVRDVISGKEVSLGKRKKQLESAAKEPELGRFGVPIDIP